MRHSRFRGCAPKSLPFNAVERVVLSGRVVRNGRTGSRMHFRGTNQGTWGENYSGDAAMVAGWGTGVVRQVLRWKGQGFYEAGVDCYVDSVADDYINPVHLAKFLQEVDWAIAAGMWVVPAFDTDEGQGVGRLTGVGNDFFDGSAWAAEFRPKFKVAWRRLARELAKRERILALELLPEPLPYNSVPSDAALVNGLYEELAAEVRQEDERTPLLVGPRASYGVNNLNDMIPFLTGPYGANAWCTVDWLTNKVEAEDTIAAQVETCYSFSVANNVAMFLQQVGRNTSEDDGAGTTTENLGLTAMNGMFSLLNALGLHWAHWQVHQNTDNAGAYALLFKTVYPGEGPDNWTPKPLEIASYSYHVKQNLPQVTAAADAAAAAASLNLFRIHGDLSNVFQDTAGTTPCTAAGQSVARINAVVGSMFFSQATAANRPTLVQLSNGEYALSFGGTHWLDSSNVTYYGTTDDTLVTVACRATASALNRVMFHNGLAASIVRYPYIALLATDDVQVSWRGDDNVHYGASSTTLCDDRAIVVTARKVANAKLLRLQGVQEGTTNNSAVGTITGPFTRMRWGANSTGGNGFTGTMPMLCVGKSATDEQARAISRLGAWLVMAPFRGAIPA